MQRYYGRLYQNQEPLQSFEWYFLKERAHYRDEECQEKGQPEWMREYLIEKADRLIVQAEGPKRTKRVNDVFISQVQKLSHLFNYDSCSQPKSANDRTRN